MSEREDLIKACSERILASCRAGTITRCHKSSLVKGVPTFDLYWQYMFLRLNHFIRPKVTQEEARVLYRAAIGGDGPILPPGGGVTR